MSKDGFFFRGALLQVCTSGMGRETWKKFCFLFDVPESVTEKGRSSVLGYLVDSGLVSSEKPGCFAEQLRNHLERHDLAQKFLELYSGRGSFGEEPAETTRVETREKTVRRSHSPERRHGKHLPEFTLPEISLPEAEEEATSQRPACFVDPMLTLEVDRASGLFRPRQGSSLSTCSNRSSGYISQRSSSVTSRESFHSWTYEESGEAAPQDVGEHLKTVPEFTRDESSSSFASGEDDEFRSCSSGSVEDIDSSDVLCSKMARLGPLSPPATKDHPLVGPLSSPAPRDSPPEVVDSPTYSQAMQTVTIQMNLDHRDLLHDIEKRQTKKLYRSTSPFSSCPPHGIQFVLRFYPTNHEGTGSALYVDVIGHSTRTGASIPPLDITVSVWDSNNKDSCTHTNDSLAYSRKGLRDGFLSQATCTVPFPKVIDHVTLRGVSGGTVIIQAVIEYSTLFSRDHH